MARPSSPRRVPPSPDVMAALYMDYLREGKPVGVTFRQYLHAIGYNDPSANVDGMDDGLRRNPLAEAGGPALISVPHTPVTGTLRLIVLLVDFSDNVGHRPPEQYRDLLFSSNAFPTGSMRDYYREVSGGRVAVEGTVHGWLRLPQPYGYYTNRESGMGRNDHDDSYPNNARRMAEDAVAAALANGVPFDPALDKFGDGSVTALFLVHAGRGAEELDRTLAPDHIWSHKWELRTRATVSGPGRPVLQATRYLTVPEDCNMGVCAHELGHLAFQWEDFYDPNGTDDGVTWAGTGSWDLMARGSWNGNRGDTPAHPVGLHKLQHGWVTATRITETTANVVVPPYTPDGGSVVIVRGPGYGPNQSLVLENRRRVGFDRQLPGAGLLVWRFDQDREQTGPARPALQLVQADGRGDLEASLGGNQGDDGDPYPGSTLRTAVDDAPGPIRTTSFPGRRSGITLSNITLDPATNEIRLTVTIAAPGPGPVARLSGPEAVSAGPDRGDIYSRIVREGRVPAEELRVLLSDATPSLVDIERQARLALEAQRAAGPAEALAPARGKKGRTAGAEARMAGPESARADDFSGLLWNAYKWANGVTWDRMGKFIGTLDLATNFVVLGLREYRYTPDRNDPFGFITADGTTLVPGTMITDAGSTPPLAWLIDDLDPLTYLKAYLIHDYEFLVHHCRSHLSRTFEQANHTLAEGIYTLMQSGEVAADWRKAALVHRGVSSPVGRAVWEKQWDVPTCDNALPR